MIKKTILITTPYLNEIGGTEIEALITAIHYYDCGSFHKVAIFCPIKSNNLFFKEIIGNRKISILHYPSLFKSEIVLFFDKIAKKFGLKRPVLEYFYWFYLNVEFNNFFILTYPGCSYFFPLLTFYNSRKKYLAKITMWHFKKISNSHFSIYKKFDNIIVFNETQKLFWKNENYLMNTVALDIMILNEENLLNLPLRTYSQDMLVFGYLGRISREKNIEDMVLLLDFLNNEQRKKCKLIIQGNGEIEYIKELELLIKSRNLQNIVIFDKKFISPDKSHFFYELIDVLLVTSTIEGGPMTSLEAAAAGCYVLGYNIGAMTDRFGIFPYVVNINFDDLCKSTLDFVILSPAEKYLNAEDFRNFYKINLSNNAKAHQLNKLLL